MIEESLATPSGCLFPYRNIATGETDMDTIWAILITYWEAVKQTFPEAWGRTPQRSRLMHGVGIRSMGRLMDKVMPAINPQAKDAVRQASAELALVWYQSVTGQTDDGRSWVESRGTNFRMSLVTSRPCRIS
jgi:hypothetical protein